MRSRMRINTPPWYESRHLCIKKFCCPLSLPVGSLNFRQGIGNTPSDIPNVRLPSRKVPITEHRLAQ